jgi:hypothetical protein
MVCHYGICSNNGGAQRRSGKRKDWMKLSLSPNLLEKLIWVTIINTTYFATKAFSNSAFNAQGSRVIIVIV